MYNIEMIKFRDIASEVGHLTPIEGTDLPYDIKRIFYIYGVPKEVERGGHAHREVYQTLVCLKGSLSIKLNNIKEEKIFKLDRPTEGLLIGKYIWNEMYDFSEDCVLLVLCSDKYDEKEYIRDYEEYRKIIGVRGK